MPRYFFDIHDGQALKRDPIGSVCDSPEAVRHEAMHALPLIAQETIPRAAKDAQAFTILVRDESNLTVYTATLTFAGLWMAHVPIPQPEDDPLSKGLALAFGFAIRFSAALKSASSSLAPAPRGFDESAALFLGRRRRSDASPPREQIGAGPSGYEGSVNFVRFGPGTLASARAPFVVCG